MNKVYLGILIVLTLALSVFAQASKTKSPPLADPTRGKNIAVMSGTSIDAELQKTVDVNSAKVGDEVVLKTTKSIRQDGEVMFPKGATLIGRITEVQRRTRQNSQSRLAVVFDRMQGKGLSTPISASIVSITSAAAGDAVMADFSSSSQTSGTASGGSGGGGLLSGVGNTVGGVVNGTTQTTGAVTNTVGNTVGSATGTVGRSLSGLQISTSANASANSSTTLSSNRNVRIEKGATFSLRVVGQAHPQE